MIKMMLDTVFPVVQWLRLCLPRQGAEVQSLVRELDPTCCMVRQKKKDARNTLQWKHTGRTRQNHKDCMEEDLQGEAQN